MNHFETNLDPHEDKSSTFKMDGSEQYKNYSDVQKIESSNVGVIPKKEFANENEFHDFFEISSGEMTTVVPLHAFSNSAIILFDNFIDLGFVSLGK
jgi:hypothetical protein